MPTSTGTTRRSRPGRARKKSRSPDREGIRVLIPERKLRARVRGLGREISRRYRGRELVVIGVLKGSFVFLADLVRSVDLSLTCDFVRVSSYGDGTTSSGQVRFEFDTTQPITGRDVLLVEDIVDTGRTVDTLRSLLLSRRPRSLRICTLLHKPERSVVRVPIEFTGFSIPNEFVVGYGLDYAGRFRNLPYIGVLRK